MKIFYITASFPYGVGESFFIPEIKALKNCGADLYIIPISVRQNLREDWHSISENCKLYSEKLLSVRIISSFFRFVFLHPILLYRLLLLLKGTTIYQFIKNLAILPKSIWIISLIIKEKPEHMHAHWGSTSSTAAMLAATITSVPWSFTCHRWDIYENNLLRRKSEYAKFVRFISNKGEFDSLKFGVISKKTVVIPMGTEIPVKPVSPGWKNNGEEFVIICPANLLPVKGHIYLIEAIDSLLQKGYKLKLLLAGEGLLRKELQLSIVEKGIENKVIFLGQLSHKALLDYYSSAQIRLMVLPSVDLGNGEHEGVPVSLMEAMSYGVPVISTQTGSINELLPKEAGLTVPEKNANELAEKIKFLYDNSEEYLKTSKLCRKIIEDDWDVNISARKLIFMIKNSSNIVI